MTTTDGHPAHHADVPLYTADRDVLVQEERVRQVQKGYTAAHDDAHTLRELAACADERLVYLLSPDGPPLTRENDAMLVEVRAVLLAVIESAERRIARAEAGALVHGDDRRS